MSSPVKRLPLHLAPPGTQPGAETKVIPAHSLHKGPAPGSLPRQIGVGLLERPSPARPKALAFTVIELLAVLGLVAAALVMLSPGLARTKSDSSSFRCLNNQRQLLLAWRMYAEDGRDALPFATSTAPLNSAYAWVQGVLDLSNPRLRDNWDLDSTIRKGALWPYCGDGAGVFHCPADASVGIDPQGQRVPRRSVSMSNWVGGDGDSPQTGYKGLWGTMSPAIVYRKLSQLQKPGPARTFVFLDERRDSINDGCFVTELDGYPNAAKAKIVDYPAGHHSGGGAFGFADGHSEIHRWEDRRTIPPFSPGGSLTLNVPSPNNPDVLWLQAHSSGLP